VNEHVLLEWVTLNHDRRTMYWSLSSIYKWEAGALYLSHTPLLFSLPQHNNSILILTTNINSISPNKKKTNHGPSSEPLPFHLHQSSPFNACAAKSWRHVRFSAKKPYISFTPIPQHQSTHASHFNISNGGILYFSMVKTVSTFKYAIQKSKTKRNQIYIEKGSVDNVLFW
jgi:hypothetical protein